MPISLTCRACQAVLRAPDSFAGQTAACPKCQSPISVPAAGQAPPPPPPAPPRRTYLFERTYLRFRGALAALARRTSSVCTGLWAWCWSGPGATAIEWALRLAIVGAGIALAVNYVQSETDRGNPASGGVWFSALLVAVVTWVSLLGWKPLVHAAARFVSAVLATGAVAVVGAAALAAGVVVSTAFVLLLLVFTAASAVVFIPMRGSQTAWLLYRRIAYVCPYDDCTFKGLPIHVCGCGTRYPDLLPGFHGLFHHTCRHPAGDVKLPTLDALGRNKLPRLCGGCERPLVLSSLGELPVWPVAVVGGTSVGKTVFIRQAARELIRLFSATGKAEVDSDEQRQKLDADLKMLDRGQVLPKTAGDVMQALGLAVRERKPGRVRCLLYLYDAPGEVFTAMQRFGAKHNLLHLSGLVLLVDPFGLPALTADAERLRVGVKPSQDPLHDLVSNLIHRVDALLTKSPSARCRLPLAVVVGKCDALPPEAAAGLWPVSPGGDGGASDRCRAALERLGAGHSVRALELKFETVRYFAGSALGRVPDARDASPFRPVGVTEPLTWLVEQVGGRTRGAV